MIFPDKMRLLPVDFTRIALKYLGRFEGRVLLSPVIVFEKPRYSTGGILCTAKELQLKESDVSGCGPYDCLIVGVHYPFEGGLFLKRDIDQENPPGGLPADLGIGIDVLSYGFLQYVGLQGKQIVTASIHLESGERKVTELLQGDPEKTIDFLGWKHAKYPIDVARSRPKHVEAIERSVIGFLGQIYVTRFLDYQVETIQLD